MHRFVLLLPVIEFFVYVGTCIVKASKCIFLQKRITLEINVILHWCLAIFDEVEIVVLYTKDILDERKISP